METHKLAQGINIIPVFTENRSSQFISKDLFPLKETHVGDFKFLTAPLVSDRRISLLGVSHSDRLLETGIIDQTDHIDTSVSIIAIYYQTLDGIVHTYDKVINWDGVDIQKPLCDFVSINGNNRELKLAATLLIEQDKSHLHDDFFMELTGSVNLETSELVVFIVAEDDSNIKPLGYDIRATRINNNRRMK